MEEMIEILQQLANKLNTTVEFLWEALIRQQYVLSVEYFIWSIFFVIILIIGSKIFLKNKNKLSKTPASGDISPYWGGMIVFTFVIIVISIFTILCLMKGIKLLINPEYYALERILLFKRF